MIHKAMNAQPNLLVIGAAGYIGKALLQQAKMRGPALGTSSSGQGGSWPLRLEAPEDFDYNRIQTGDVVFVTAAISAPDVCAREPERAKTVNVTGTMVLIDNALRQGARVVFFSSDTVYGERAQAFDEQAPCQPAGDYAAMKHEVEQHFADKPQFKSIRLSHVFSREDKFTSYITGCAQRQVPVELFHPFLRAMIHRDDVVAGALALAERWDATPESVINFGGPDCVSRVDLASCLQKNCFPDLQLQVTQPPDDFFKQRPRVIAMTSPVLARLLDRSPRSVEEAVRLEFPQFNRSRAN